MRNETNVSQLYSQDTPKSVDNLKEQIGDTEARLNKRLDLERKERMDDIQDIKQDIDRIVGAKEQAGVNVPSLVSII